MPKLPPYISPSIADFLQFIGWLSIVGGVIGGFLGFVGSNSFAATVSIGVIVNGLINLGLAALADLIGRAHYNTQFISAQLDEMKGQLDALQASAAQAPAEPSNPVRVKAPTGVVDLSETMDEIAHERRARARKPLNDVVHTRNQQRLREMRAKGISEVRVTAEGPACPVCSVFLNRIVPIASAPTVPPPGCTCEPFCNCIIDPAG